MIELDNNGLVFSFPEMHPEARLRIEFQRTLRIPDDGKSYPLPPGLGAFPMRHVDDHAGRVPPAWIRRGGVMLPMYQSEALWINFNSDWVLDHGTPYPVAIKIATGKVSAITGEPWSLELGGGDQDWVVAPDQPWLDGYVVKKGVVRQFVAMPLGAGYSAEEQLTGHAEHGGIQIVAYPMRRGVFERRFPKGRQDRMRGFVSASPEEDVCGGAAATCAGDMGLAPGGTMRQEIYDDPYERGDWDTERGSRCFVHLTNSLVWRAVTGQEPPTTPPTAAEYTHAGLPWFDYYSDRPAVDGTAKLDSLKSVKELGEEKGDVPLPENAPVDPEHVVQLRAGLAPGQVREADF